MRCYLLAMLASLTLFVAGCSSENPDTPGPGKEEPGLDFSVIADKNVTLQPEGGSFTIKLTSPCSWEISLLNDRAKDWISFSKTSGSKGNHEVTVYVEENKEHDTREATVRVKTLRKASQGKGVNLVLMGDGYTDAMIADGTYDAAIKRMYDVLFVEEPYKSLSDRFNVYQVIDDYRRNDNSGE